MVASVRVRCGCGAVSSCIPCFMCSPWPACSLHWCFMLQFAWNVEGIEDAEDDFESDLDLDADVDANAAANADAGAGASNAADFDKELAEFENAFD